MSWFTGASFLIPSSTFYKFGSSYHSSGKPGLALLGLSCLPVILRDMPSGFNYSCGLNEDEEAFSSDLG
jgi:hypothetical protein